MPQVTVKRTAPDDAAFRAHIDGVALTFKDGEATKNVSSGEHALTWFIHSAPGSKYSIAITAPAEAKFEHKATIDGSLKDGGLHWFMIA